MHYILSTQLSIERSKKYLSYFKTMYENIDENRYPILNRILIYLSEYYVIISIQAKFEQNGQMQQKETVRMDVTVYSYIFIHVQIIRQMNA